MINIKNLEKCYHEKGKPFYAIKAINLSLQSGEIFGVIGPSGAGKSTLIRCLNLLERPTAGQIIIDDCELTKQPQSVLRAERRKIGMIFQHFNLLASRTVYQNIAFPLTLTHMRKTAIESKVQHLLELTHLTDRKDYYPSQLSGGQKQRVAIARALANNPKVLLCDEATSALDPESTHTILQLLKAINQRLGLTILLITHEMQVVKEICHRLAIIEKGHIIEQANVLEFFSAPKSQTAKRFIRQTVEHDLPENIKTRILATQSINSFPLVRISFLGKTAEQPLITTLLRKYEVEINILLANIEKISDQLVGTMVVLMSGDADKIQASIKFLTTIEVNVEVLGYVQSDV